MRLACLLLTACLAMPALADEVVFYRCTDGAGQLTIQNAPCPKGSRSERKVMQAVATVPMGASAAPAKPAAAGTATTAPAPGTAPATDNTRQPETPATSATNDAPREDARPRLPPPPVFQCTTYDRDSYITESDEPQKRCVPLRTVGLDGNPTAGAGQACDMVYDQCARVPDGGLCAAWKKRLGETEVAFRFGRSENSEKNRSEFERVQRIVNESTCSD